MQAAAVTFSTGTTPNGATCVTLTPGITTIVATDAVRMLSPSVTVNGCTFLDGAISVASLTVTGAQALGDVQCAALSAGSVTVTALQPVAPFSISGATVSLQSLDAQSISSHPGTPWLPLQLSSDLQLTPDASGYAGLLSASGNSLAWERNRGYGAAPESLPRWRFSGPSVAVTSDFLFAVGPTGVGLYHTIGGGARPVQIFAPPA